MSNVAIWGENLGRLVVRTVLRVRAGPFRASCSQRPDCWGRGAAGAGRVTHGHLGRRWAWRAAGVYPCSEAERWWSPFGSGAVVVTVRGGAGPAAAGGARTWSRRPGADTLRVFVNENERFGAQTGDCDATEALTVLRTTRILEGFVCGSRPLSWGPLRWPFSRWAAAGQSQGSGRARGPR